PGAATDLTSGVSASGSVAFDATVWYRIQATSGHTRLAVQLSNLSADADLEIYRDTQTGAPACRSAQFGTANDSCQVDFTGSPMWFIAVYGYEAANYSVMATLTGATPPPPTPTPTPPPSGGGGGGGGGMIEPGSLLLLLLAFMLRVGRGAHSGRRLHD
ncbi:MAG: hypothetical protein ACREV5_19520, partial [Steroidobacter sp.]